MVITGKVQGVWFRASTKQQAELLGITGWVRNTSDGRVEAVFQGDNALVEKMIAWCHQGPPLSHVDHVHITKEQQYDDFPEFKIR